MINTVPGRSEALALMMQSVHIALGVLFLALSAGAAGAAQVPASGEQQITPRCKELAILRDTRLFDDTTRIQETIALMNETVAELKALQKITAKNKREFFLTANADLLLHELVVVINALKLVYGHRMDLGELEGRPGLTAAFVAEQIASRAFIVPQRAEEVAKSRDIAEIGLALAEFWSRIGEGFALYNSTLALVREGKTLDIDWDNLKSTTSQLMKQLNATSRQLQSARFRQLFLQKLKDKIDAECGGSKKATPAKEVTKSATVSFPSFVTPGKTAPAAKPVTEKKEDRECAVLGDERGVDLAVADLEKFEQLKHRCQQSK
jgi:hypothetical protein